MTRGREKATGASHEVWRCVYQPRVSGRNICGMTWSCCSSNMYHSYQRPFSFRRAQRELPCVNGGRDKQSNRAAASNVQSSDYAVQTLVSSTPLIARRGNVEERLHLSELKRVVLTSSKLVRLGALGALGSDWRMFAWFLICNSLVDQEHIENREHRLGIL